MGRPIESLVGSIQSVNISHQEIGRILTALEEMYVETKRNAPGMEWMPLESVGSLLCHELGYEDMDEFEDAMGASWKEFVGNFPVVELKDSEVTGGRVFKFREDPPREDWVPTKFTTRIRNNADLKCILHKSKFARVCVPALEFEIQPDGRRHIDTLYNHFGDAVTVLAAHASGLSSGTQQETKERIVETVEGITALLDVPREWEVVVYDPSGISEFLPDGNVDIERYNPAEEGN